MNNPLFFENAMFVKTVHKDRKPKDTIGKIRSILEKNGIFILEKKWTQASSFCHSVQLEDAELPIRCNGKGVTNLYSLASGHGEFMERLQNGLLISPTYGLMHDRFSFFKDETSVDFSAVAQEWPEMMSSMIAFPLDQSLEKELYDEELRCAPFFSVSRDEVVSLPIELIELSCRSNGLCAGNTPAEALTQGLCEIAERYAVKTIIMDSDRKIPTIPRSFIEDTAAIEIVRSIEAIGHTVLVKDCSVLGFPVLAAIILNQNKSAYKVSFGSDPVLGTALERCLTEAFQGCSDLAGMASPLNFAFDKSVEQSYTLDRHKRFLEFTAFAMNGQSVWPDHFFIDEGSPSYNTGFLSDFIDSRHSLNFMLGCFSKMKMDVYIRDTSILGFPAYRIYVPGITELGLMNLDKPLLSKKTREFARKCLLRLKSTTTEDLAKFADHLVEMMDFPIYHHRIFTASPFDPKIYVDDNSDFSAIMCLGVHRLLSLIYIRMGDFPRAAESYATYLQTSAGGDATTYERACYLYLKLKADGLGDDLVLALGSVYGKELAEEVAQDLAKPELIFQYLSLPECGDCTSCPSKSECKYLQWKAVAEKIDATSAQCIPCQTRVREAWMT